MIHVAVPVRTFRWAIERSNKPRSDLQRRFPKLSEWEAGGRRPTLKQLEAFAKATYTPIGYFFLNEPPEESVPIPDYRTARNARLEQPTRNLLDVIYLCQQRQEWYRNNAREVGEVPYDFVGSARATNDVVATAKRIRTILGFDLDQRRRFPTWVEALRSFVDQVDRLGVLVMVSSVVGSNSRRRLDPGEFRGFALVDSLAPLVFVNGADTKAAQMFTLAHELAHVWLGESALSDIEPHFVPTHNVERWCNQVAAELLVPLEFLRHEYRPEAPLREEIDRLARQFKVSTLVILCRIHDTGGLTRQELWTAYDVELERLLTFPRASGGDYYLSTAARVSKRFARAIVIAAWEGRASFSEAFRLLGCRKMTTFREFGHSLGIEA
jgi:Zn-dependent peptidase ImmA (M78 family)